MPDLLQDKVRTPETTPTQGPESTPGANLQPRGNEAAQQQLNGKDEGLANYEASLGRFIGKPLYEAVAGALSFDKLKGSARSAVFSALESLVDQLGSIDNVTADPKALDTLGKLLSDTSAPHVDKLLEKYGPELTGKLAKWAGAHPRTILTIALLAAAGAVLANVPIPELKQSLKLGKVGKLDLEAKLGKIRDVSLEKIKAKLSAESGPLAASLEVGKDGDKLGGGGSLTLGDKDRKLSLDGKFDDRGLTVIGLGAHLAVDDDTQVDGRVSKDRDKKAIGTVTVTDKDGKTTRTDDYKYDANTGVFTLGRAQLFEDGGLSLKQKSTWGSDGTGSVGLGVSGKGTDLFQQGDKGSASLDFSRDVGKDAYGLTETDKLKLGLAYSRSDLNMKLDAALSSRGESTVSGSVNKSWANGHKAGANFSARLDDPKLLELGAFYGFKDPKEFKSFLVEYKHKAGAVSENELAYTVENTLADVKLRWQQSLKWGGKGGTQLDTSLMGAKFFNKDTAFLAGAQHHQDFSTGKGSFTPQVGVQYKGVPVTLGYDMERKAVKIGISIPF